MGSMKKEYDNSKKYSYDIMDEISKLLEKKDIQVVIAEDNMSATLLLSRPGDTETPYTYDK